MIIIYGHNYLNIHKLRAQEQKKDYYLLWAIEYINSSYNSLIIQTCRVDFVLKMSKRKSLAITGINASRAFAQVND